MTHLACESARVGLAVMVVLVAVWGTLLWVRTPESDRFLELARQPPGVGACFDCPVFILLGRGVGGNGNVVDLLPTLVSLPALIVTGRLAAPAMVPTLDPAVFLAALLAQSLAMGVATRLYRLWRRNRRENAKRLA